MVKGIDVSEHNGIIDWDAVVEEGVSFVIIRLGWGNAHIDEMFYENYKAAKNAGLRIGIYYYSYALNEYQASAEAQFVLDVLKASDISVDDIPMGCWFDLEDADGYKERCGMPSNQTMTDMCSAFICTLNSCGFPCGIYASLDWLLCRIDTSQLAEYVPYWCAQWDSCCDFSSAIMWQYTASLEIGDKFFDGNLYFG